MSPKEAGDPAARSPDVTISRPEKLLWPDLAFTKQDYAEYLRAIADDMLPWLRERPLTTVRAPDGVGGKRYYQVVDIDPPEEAFELAVEVAFLVLEVLDDLDLPSGVKTTGGKGLHVVVPMERRVDQQELRSAVTRLTEIVVGRRPDLVTDAFRKAKRGGHVMLDPSRNGTGATIVAPYSPRVRADATVSFPVASEELKAVSPGDFTLRTVPGSLGRPGPNRWKALADERGRLPARLLRPE